MSKDTGGPAFPSHGTMGEVVCEGISMRDYFAAKAPDEPEWFAEHLAQSATYVDSLTQLTMWRYAYADAMLKARQA